ncbi:MAG TPA: hypothetical protein VKP61_00050 [Candidatus Acidoferrum sp.]|nr:hypothetical protein [Candidatus Acidoferrum sp.]
MEVAEVYKAFDSTGITNVHEMARCLRCAAHFGQADRILDISAKWGFRTGCDSFGHAAYFDYIPWFNYLRMAADAGYYGLAMVDFEGRGGPETNHWVLICGARTKGMRVNETITGEILTSCSVRGERWYEACEFLKKMGGYDTLLVRPS